MARYRLDGTIAAGVEDRRDEALQALRRTSGWRDQHRANRGAMPIHLAHRLLLARGLRLVRDLRRRQGLQPSLQARGA